MAADIHPDAVNSLLTGDHGAPFDEDCEWCELEFAEGEWLERMERTPQIDWLGYRFSDQLSEPRS